MEHVRGVDRQAAATLPARLDEWIEADHIVRVIDAWVDRLDLAVLGFAHVTVGARGRPPYAPGDLLKLYLYGYLHQVRTSRRLERECRRNIEVMWLLRRLAPDHKTIAHFRRTHPDALAAVCATFVDFARRQHLIGADLIAIDGTKVRAVASERAVTSPVKLRERQAVLCAAITDYLARLDAADATEGAPLAGQAASLRQTVAELVRERERVRSQTNQLVTSGRPYLVTTEPGARLMRCRPGQAVPGYNLQSAVDARHGLIVHHAVCCEVNDGRQLWPMAHRVRERLGRQVLTVVADGGYSNVAQLKACEAEGITAYLPIQRSKVAGAPGLYPKQAFTYDAGDDCYRCPQGQRLDRKQVASKDRLVIYAARSPSTCGQCPVKGQCTSGTQRYISRHQDEAVYEHTQARLASHPEMMALRRQTVEPPFGTIKERILGNARLLLRGLGGARAELNLAVLAYNFRRVTNLLGTEGALRAARTG